MKWTKMRARRNEMTQAEIMSQLNTDLDDLEDKYSKLMEENRRQYEGDRISILRKYRKLCGEYGHIWGKPRPGYFEGCSPFRECLVCGVNENYQNE